MRDGTIDQGLAIGCDLDINIVYKPGSFNIIMGQSNVGKTDWVLWYLTCLVVRQMLKWIIFSSENHIGSLKRKIIQFMTGRDLKNLSDEDYNAANQKMNNYFLFINTDKLYSAVDLLRVFEKNKDRYDGAIVDPYNSLKRVSGVNSHDYDYEIVNNPTLKG